MTSGAPIDSSGEPLAVLHTRLDAHFRALRESRDEHAIGTPIFALEHGLTDAEVALMKFAVCSAVRVTATGARRGHQTARGRAHPAFTRQR